MERISYMFGLMKSSWDVVKKGMVVAGVAGWVLLVATSVAAAAGQETAGPPDTASLYGLADSTPDRVLLAEDFEGLKPLMLELSGGRGRSKEVVSEVVEGGAYSGKRCWRAVIIFEPAEIATSVSDAVYVLPKEMPIWSNLRLKMHVKVVGEPPSSPINDVRAGFGGDGAVKTATDDKGWVTWEATVRRNADPARSVPGAGVYIQMYGVKVPTTVTVYVDDITIQGRLPEDWQMRWGPAKRYYAEQNEKETRALAARRLKDVVAWQTELDTRYAKLTAPRKASPAILTQYRAATQKVNDLLKGAKAPTENIRNVLADKQKPFSGNVNSVERMLTEARRYLDIAEGYAAYAAIHPEPGYITYALDVTQSYAVLPTGPTAHNEELSYYSWDFEGGFENPQLLPNEQIVAAVPSRLLSNFGCRGTYVPYSFAIHAVEALDGLTFTLGELAGPGANISPAQTDLRVVAPVSLPWGAKPRLFNCMLVHDPEFVVVKPDGTNKFKDAKFGSDTDVLRQPATIPAGTTRQFYLLVKVPEAAPAGVYRGVVKAATADGKVIAFPIVLEVLGFSLEPTPYAYSAYSPTYPVDQATERLPEDTHGSKGSFAQMAAGMRDMAEHGCNTLNLSGSGQGSMPAELSELDRCLAAAKQAGLTRSPFVYNGRNTGWSLYPSEAEYDTIEKVVELVKRRVIALSTFCRERGYPQPAFYGHDEASGDKLAILKTGYQAANDAGGIVAAACYPSYFDDVGTALSLPIVYGGAQTAEGRVAIRASQKAGYECWIYNCPATNMQASPSVYRRRYGLCMWKNGEQGATPWAYDNMGTYHFEERAGRPVFVFAFPTWSGKPIDTIIFEAYREGIYDTRYMATLEKYLKKVKAARKAGKLVAEVEDWLANVSVHEDLQSVRRKMADYTLKLIGAMKQK